MRKFLIGGVVVLICTPVVNVMADYAVNSNYCITNVSGTRYVVKDCYNNDYQSDHYTCGTSPDYGGPEYTGMWYALRTGEVIDVDEEYYYCCGNGSFVDITSEYPLDESRVCGTEYNYVPLGDNKYCYSAKSVSLDPCGGYSDRYVSGSGYDDAPGCQRGLGDLAYCGICTYDSTCKTFTHCGRGYYKDGDKCVECPDGGTTSGFTSGGKTECYIPSGDSFTDDTGSGSYTNDCYWKN